MKKKIIILLLLILVPIIYFIVNNNKLEDVQEKVIPQKKYTGIFKDNYEEAEKYVEKMSIEEKVGQLFLVRYNYKDTEYLSNFYPGGYILFAKDFQNHTQESIKKEIDEVQKINKHPLIIGVDEEGGTVTRVSRFTEYRNEKFKSPREYYDEGGYELLEKTEEEKANLLKSLGINLNLAPVADISTNENDYMHDRSFGYDRDKTTEYITKMVEYSHNNKINATLKHFPGYSNNNDTHTGIAIDERDYETIKNNDYKPFEAGIKANVESVLVSHNIVKCIDEDNPSSLSKKVVGELRNKLGFTGIIMTDDLSMDAVKSYVDNNSAAIKAINAGNDMIITSDFLTMKNEILKAIETKEIDEETINKAVTRIIAWKYYSGLIKEQK